VHGSPRIPFRGPQRSVAPAILVLFTCLGAAGAEPGMALTNSLGMVLRSVPKGTFTMGTDAADMEQWHRPASKVTLSRGYYVSAYCVTADQFDRFRKMKRESWQRGGDPIRNVTWSEAMRFCFWLSLKEKRVYCLPTEAEWERAARGGLEGKRYEWGDEIPAAVKVMRAGRHVETTPPNGYGLHLMTAGVHEWCWDWYAGSRSGNLDPAGPRSGKYKVTRGGSQPNQEKGMRVACRSGHTGSDRINDVGFRIALIGYAESEKDMAALVGKLGARTWDERKAARKRLESIGAPALPALRARRDDPDPEIAMTCKEIIGVLEGRDEAGLKGYRADLKDLVGALRRAAVEVDDESIEAAKKALKRFAGRHREYADICRGFRAGN